MVWNTNCVYVFMVISDDRMVYIIIREDDGEKCGIERGNILVGCDWVDCGGFSISFQG